MFILYCSELIKKWCMGFFLFFICTAPKVVKELELTFH